VTIPNLGNMPLRRYCEDCVLWIRRNEQENKDIEMKLRRERIRSEWRGQQLPPLFIDKNFSSFEHDRGDINKVYKWCVNYADNYQYANGYPSLVLYSKNNGVGKTHLLISIFHRIIDRWTGDIPSGASPPCPASYFREVDLLSELRACQRFDSGITERQLYGKLSVSKMLIIDDLGKGKTNDTVREFYFRLIDLRYITKKPVVLSSNLDPEELINYMGSAACDRLMAMCKKAIQVPGESYRGCK